MRHLPIAASPVSPGPALANRRHVLAAGAATLVASQASVPSKPVTLIVPFTAGGASDVGARMLGTELGKLLGQTVVVENLAGAGGAPGNFHRERHDDDDDSNKRNCNGGSERPVPRLEEEIDQRIADKIDFAASKQLRNQIFAQQQHSDKG